MFFSTSSNNALQFSVYRFFISVVKFIPRYFSFSEISLLVHRRVVDFCTLILCPAALLYLFIDGLFMVFWWTLSLMDSLWFSAHCLQK